MKKPHLAQQIVCDFCGETFPQGVYEPFTEKYGCLECMKLMAKASMKAIELLLLDVKHSNSAGPKHTEEDAPRED